MTLKHNQFWYKIEHNFWTKNMILHIFAKFGISNEESPSRNEYSGPFEGIMLTIKVEENINIYNSRSNVVNWNNFWNVEIVYQFIVNLSICNIIFVYKYGEN